MKAKRCMMKGMCLFLLSVFSFPFTVSFAQERIMVIADPHVYPKSEIQQQANFDTYMKTQRKMLDLSEPIWCALMDTVRKYRPSLVLIPGDLTKDGETASHAMVSESLKELDLDGIRTLVIPGNHDLPGVTWETLYPGTYRNAAKDPNSHSYAVEPLNGVTVLGIDGSNGSASIGTLSDATLTWLWQQADAAVTKGNMIIAMTHWQILDHFDGQSTLESSCRFKNADDLRDQLMAHGVHVVLTGHFHVSGISTYRNAAKTDSIVEITTGSPITYPCPYRWLTVSSDRSTLNVETQNLTSVDTIADLTAYSREWMREHTANLIPALAPRAWNKVQSYKAEAISKVSFAAKIMCGFSGNLADTVDHVLPSTDAEVIALAQRYMQEPLIDLYLFHSEANENERPSVGEAIAKALNDSMAYMMLEMIKESDVLSCLSDAILGLAKAYMKEPVESIIYDKTSWQAGSLLPVTYTDQTNDLKVQLNLNAPRQATGISDLSPMDNDQSQIMYDLLGRPVMQPVHGQLYILNGQKILY